ncbi:MAG: hypothetical protein GY906_16445 [bacterium]|nr:hypothetical protein [bacterium]
MTTPATDPAVLERHLKRMKMIGIFFVTAQPVTLIILFLVRGSYANALLSPAQMTLLLAAGALWLAFTAERDAKKRLAHAKHGFTVHGDQARLLREHLLVYLQVLLRLEFLSVCGVLTSYWGKGPLIAIWFVILATILMALTWPTPRKTKLLIERAYTARREVAD